MGEIRWTEDQQKVISLRDRNLLVSASAGSGKTAVLVERIIQKITDEKNPVDVDRLLVVTFTRAAAAEMKGRIVEALEQLIYDNPENARLQRQMTLVHTAQITTIDGFCAYLLKNYYHLIGLDAGYRIGEEGELKLLRQDVMNAFLEERYREGNSDFLTFAELAAPGKNDEAISSLIMKVYDQAMSNPDPEKWLEHCANACRDEEEFRRSPLYEILWEQTERQLLSASDLLSEAEDLCADPEDGLEVLLPALESDKGLCASLLSCSGNRDFDRMAGELRNLKFKAFSRTKEGCDARKKEEVKLLREEEKEILKSLANDLFDLSFAQQMKLSDLAGEQICVISELARGFMEAFRREKRKKNVLDFNDIEHLALQILRGSGEEMSDAARELSEKYEEIMIDEYQDSNLLQETIMNCVSGWAVKRRNLFMVGDVKQSIYRFRLARPELFMEKYERYPENGEQEQKIDLHMNFRSRSEVLGSVNYLFRSLMGKDMGGITYDDAAALYCGADYPEAPQESDLRTEILIAEHKEDEGREAASGDRPEESEEKTAGGNERKSAQETEALMIAQRIRELMNTQKIYDRKSKEYREIRYGDIVILLRTYTGWAETFAEVLKEQGIPVYTVSRTGYFSAAEVQTLLCYLQICSNPRQDIPLAGVLRSPFAELSPSELADVRAEFPEGLLYDSIRAFSEKYGGEDGEKDAVGKKIRTFLTQLDAFRERSMTIPVHQLIAAILKETGFGNAAASMPGGAQRRANLSMLIARAREYEKTSYKGLFNFIRYIEQLKKYEVDFGEANLSGAGDGAVSIMTIHKSKGLEFPVVFAAGMGKSFNFNDVNAGVLIHPDLGIGMDAVLPDLRCRMKTLQKTLIRNVMYAEELGEDLRILYVAFTRAKEKLIITGTMKDVGAELEKAAASGRRGEMLLPYRVRRRARNGWDFILPALSGHHAMQELFSEAGCSVFPSPALQDPSADFVVRIIGPAQMARKAAEQELDSLADEEILKHWDEEREYDPEIRKALDKQFSCRYPFEELDLIPEKVSVSELKKRSYADESELEENILAEPDVIPLIPEFIEKKETGGGSRGAERGTAYHAVMEHLDYAKTGEEELTGQIAALEERGLLTKPQADSIRTEDIRIFLETDLGRRMQDAALHGKLYREQPFMILRNASELDPSWMADTGVLVQGIIDAYFLEEDEIVLVDYKTDFVHRGQEQKLIDLYHVQLEDYACALNRLTKKNVKEIYIYSFTLGKCIPLPAGESGGGAREI